MPRERREGARTHVVFNALGIAFGDFRRNAQCLQKSDDDFVALLADFSQALAVGREENCPVGSGGEVAGALQSGEGVVDGHMGHAKPVG